MSKNRSQSMRERWSDPTERSKLSTAISKAQHQRSHEMSRITKELWSDPEYRSKQSSKIPHNKTHESALLHFVCEVCGNEFTDRPCRKNRKTCSKTCAVARRTGMVNLKNRGKKPSHRAGRGIHCIYRGFKLRSLYELSFIINFLEKNSIDAFSYETVHLKQLLPDGTQKLFLPDFVVNDTKVLYEVKPKKQLVKVLEKIEICRQLALDAGWNYVVMTEDDFDILSYDEVASLVCKGVVTLLRRKNPGVCFKRLLSLIEKRQNEVTHECS